MPRWKLVVALAGSALLAVVPVALAIIVYTHVAWSHRHQIAAGRTLWDRSTIMWTAATAIRICIAITPLWAMWHIRRDLRIDIGRNRYAAHLALRHGLIFEPAVHTTRALRAAHINAHLVTDDHHIDTLRCHHQASTASALALSTALTIPDPPRGVVSSGSSKYITLTMRR